MGKKAIVSMLLGALLCACNSADSPACAFEGEPEFAPSAGCFLVIEERLLVVQNLWGALSPPGGSSAPGESAQCTALRETWEETGLRLQAGRRLDTFATGFHLYECHSNSQSGDIAPPPRLEVRRAFFLHVDEFDRWDWRYPGQEAILGRLITGQDRPAN